MWLCELRNKACLNLPRCQMNTEWHCSRCGQVGVTGKRRSLSRRGHRPPARHQPVPHLENNGQDAFPRLPGPRSWPRSLWGGSWPAAETALREGTVESLHGEEGRKKGRGGPITIHPRLDTFSEVYWKFSPLSCSIKRKKRKKQQKKTCCNFLCHRTCSGKNRPDPLLHFPICTNGQSPHPEPPLLLI